MDQALRSRLGHWFAAIEIDDGELPPTVTAGLLQLVEMLEALDPTRVDRRRSSIRQQGHGRERPGRVDVHLAHDTDENADLFVIVSESDAIVSWLSAHEHVFPEDGDDERPWTTVVADVVAAALRGEYVVENHYCGKRLTKSRIVDIADPDRPRVIGTTGSLVGWLPWPGEKRVEVEHADYGLQGPLGRA